MQNEVYKKLKSTRGASLVLVLVLFLMCAMVSSVIVAAAASGSARNASHTNQQQAYLAMSSAVELIMAELPKDGDTCEIVEETKDYTCNATGLHASSYAEIRTYGGQQYYWFQAEYRSYRYYPYREYDVRVPVSVICGNDGDHDYNDDHSDVLVPTSEVTMSMTGQLKEVIAAACKHVYTTGTAYNSDFTLKVDDEEGRISEIPELAGTFTMKDDYSIVIKLGFPSGGSYSAAGAEISMLCNEIGNPPEEEVELSCIHDVEYYKTGNNSGWKSLNEYGFPGGKKITKTTTITWGNPTYKREN